MADTKVTGLSAGNVPALSDLVYGVKGGSSRKHTIADIANAIGVGQANELVWKGSGAVVASIITDTLDLTPYHTVEVFVNNAVPDTDPDQTLAIHISDDDGATWDGTTDYEYVTEVQDASKGVDDTNSAGGDQTRLNGDSANWWAGGNTNEQGNWKITLQDPAGPRWKSFFWQGVFSRDQDGLAAVVYGGGQRQITGAINKIRIKFDGNISADVYIVGYLKTPRPVQLPVFTGGQEVIETVQFSGATVGESGALDLSRFFAVDVFLTDVIVATDDNNTLAFEVSVDAGVGWGTTDYNYHSRFNLEGSDTPAIVRGAASSTGLALVDDTAASGIGSAANESGAWTVRIMSPAGAEFKKMSLVGGYNDATAPSVFLGVTGQGEREETDAIDKIRITAGADGGNIAGKMTIVGYLKQGQETPLARGHLWRDSANPLIVLDATDRDHDATFTAPIHVRDEADSINLRLTADMKKLADTNWAQGDGAGGKFPAAAFAADTTYFPFIIGTAQGDIDCGWDSDIDCANIPSGWAYYRRLEGATMRTAGTAIWLPPPGVVVLPPVTGWTRTDGTNTSGAENYFNGEAVVLKQASGSNDDRVSLLERTMPSTPYILTARLSGRLYGGHSNGGFFGIGARDNATGKLHLFYVSVEAARYVCKLTDWTDLNTFSANIDSIGSFSEWMSGGNIWFRLIDDGTDMTWLISFDGVFFHEISSRGRTAFVATPDRLFFANYGQLTAGVELDMVTLCDSWHIG